MGRVLAPPAANTYSERVGAHVEAKSESVARAVDVVEVVRVVGNEGEEARGGEGAEVTWLGLGLGVGLGLGLGLARVRVRVKLRLRLRVGRRLARLGDGLVLLQRR